MGFLLIVMLSVVMLDSVGYTAPPSKNYSLVFSDEMSGGSLNTSKWSTYHVCWDVRTLAGVGHLQYYIESGFGGLGVNPHVMSGGILSLTANNSPNQAATGNLPYTSGMISTEQSHNQLYGYFEVRMRVPDGQGFWPAIWMIPSDCGDHLPEIDVLEVLGHQNTTVYTFGHPNECGDPCLTPISGTNTHVNVIDASDGFHVYGLEWTASYVAWFIDGREVRRVENFANEPHYLIVNFAVGGSWPGNPDGSTVFPSSVDVDYVRIYKILPAKMFRTKR